MFEFETEEQKEIRDSVRKLASKEIPLYQNEDHYGTVPRELFKSFSKLGLTGLAIDTEHGGLQGSPLTISIVMEEIAAVDLGCSVFLAVHFLCSGIINRFGNDPQKEAYLSKLAEGELLGAFALTEPGAGSDAANISTTLKPTEGGYLVTGEKCYITNGGFADLYVGFGKYNDQFVGFIFDKDREGVEFGPPEKKMGGELSPISSVKFNDLKINEDDILGELSDGYKIALSGLASGRINIAACANGISRAAIQRAIAHLQERKQFGKELIDFQGLQFILADMEIKLQASQLLTWQAARELAEDPKSKNNRLFPSLAKCHATDSAMAIATDAVQLLGGAGYIADYQVERLMREAKMLQIVEGTNQIQRSIIAKQIQETY